MAKVKRGFPGVQMSTGGFAKVSGGRVEGRIRVTRFSMQTTGLTAAHFVIFLELHILVSPSGERHKEG